MIPFLQSNFHCAFRNGRTWPTFFFDVHSRDRECKKRMENWIGFSIRSAPFQKSLIEISFNFSFITSVPRRLYEGTKCCTKLLCYQMKTLKMGMLCFFELQNDSNWLITWEKIADSFASHFLTLFDLTQVFAPRMLSGPYHWQSHQSQRTYKC